MPSLAWGAVGKICTTLPSKQVLHFFLVSRPSEILPGMNYRTSPSTNTTGFYGYAYPSVDGRESEGKWPVLALCGPQRYGGSVGAVASKRCLLPFLHPSVACFLSFRPKCRFQVIHLVATVGKSGNVSFCLKVCSERTSELFLSPDLSWLKLNILFFPET
jgi:hypothetical protein